VNGLRRVLSNAFFLFIARNISLVLNYLLVIFLTRLLGPELYGSYEVALLVVSLAAIVSGFGMDLWAVRQVAKQPRRCSEYFSNVVAAKLILSAGLLGFVLVVACLVESAELATLLAIGAVSIPFTGIFDAACAFLQAFERMKVLALALSLLSALVTAAAVAVLLMGGAAEAVMLVFVGGMVVRATALSFIARRIDARFRPGLVNRRVIAGILRESAPFAALGILSVLYYKVDVLLLRALKSSLSVGLYVPGLRTVEILLFVPNTFAVAVYPFFVKVQAQGNDGLLRLYPLCAKFFLLLGILVSILLFGASDWLVARAFGPRFAPTAGGIRILAFMLPFAFCNAVFGRAMLAIGKERLSVLYVSSATVLNAVLNWIVIPRYDFRGAAAMTVLSEVLSTVAAVSFLWYFLGRPRFSDFLLKPVATLLACSLCAVGTRWLQLGRPLGIVLPVFVFVSLVFLLGQLNRDQLRQLAAFWRARPIPAGE